MRQIPAGVPVLVDAVLPVDEAAVDLYGNAEVRAANAVIARACAARPGCRFVDTSGGLAGPGGGLDPRFHDGDGLHLNPEGQRAWRAALAAVLDPYRSF
jgi:lysophospholipase L1-like esterase